MESLNHSEKSINSNSQERIQTIEQYIQNYFKKYINNKESSVKWVQGTHTARFFWGTLDRDFMKPIKNILEEKLNGKSLVDLGCGNNDGNFPMDVKISLKKFTAVDIDPPVSKNKAPNNSDEGVVYGIQKMKDNGITKNASIVKEDILRYVANLPDGSSNFFLSALDDDVIVEEEYWKYLSEEICRATENGGIIINAGVGRIGDYLDRTKFKTIYSDENQEGKRIYEKIA